jgi:hypothetical protein
MKKFFPPVMATVLFVFLVASCQRNSSDYLSVAKQEKPITITDQAVVLANRSAPQGSCNPDAYTIALESKTLVDGNWEWVWSIQNLNPGNGSNGTSQDLSNWGMPLGFCVSWESVVGAGYSANGSNWTNFTPTYEVNPSQGCLTMPVIKFDYGTTGSAKSYFRLVVNRDYNQSSTLGYYKSGRNTSCCTFNFTGMGCGGVEEVVE